MVSGTKKALVDLIDVHMTLKKHHKLYVIYKNGSKISIAPYVIGTQPGTHNTLLFEKYSEQIQDDDQKTYYFVYLDQNEL